MPNYEKAAELLIDKVDKLREQIKELKADACPSWMGKEKGCNEAQDVVELHDRIKELEADLANYFEMAAKSYTACGNYQQRIGELEAKVQKLGDGLILIRKSTEIMEARRFAEQALNS